jgi:hypothetical protein
MNNEVALVPSNCLHEFKTVSPGPQLMTSNKESILPNFRIGSSLRGVEVELSQIR